MESKKSFSRAENCFSAEQLDSASTEADSQRHISRWRDQEYLADSSSEVQHPSFSSWRDKMVSAVEEFLQAPFG